MNHRIFVFGLSAFFLLMLCASQSAVAQMMPGVGYTTSLSTNFHDVSGTVTVLDADTLLVEDFTYDGLGISVFFYLATSQNTIGAGLPIGSQLLGTAFDGTEGPFTIDLPEGMTVDGYSVVSVWCEVAEASFGDGTFAPGVILGDVNMDGVINFSDIPSFVAVLSAGEFQAQADCDQSGELGFSDIPPFIDILSSQ